MAKRLPTRAEYRYFLEIPTRWMDNDVYRHVNTLPRWCDVRAGDRA
jgi:acyl-CoA thioester hydrolase